MSESINVDTTVTTINIVTTGQQGPAGPKGDPGNFDPSVIENMQNQVDNLETEVDQVKTLAQTNELKISTKTDQSDFEQAQQHIEQNRLALLTKADIQALAMLSQLVDTKADQSYVNQQISNLVGSAPEALNTIYELAAAIQNEQGLIESLNQSVANRVRFDVATQALTEIQKENARTNIGAEKIGTAQQLVSQITAQSLGAATAAQGAKADTALQSADVAPVALSGLFSSLSGQSKIFDVVFGAYQVGTNTAIAATDSLGKMLGKLQAQVNAKAIEPVWVDIKTISGVTLHTAINNASTKIEVAKIGGNLWMRGFISINGTLPSAAQAITVNNSDYAIDYIEYSAGNSKVMGPSAMFSQAAAAGNYPTSIYFILGTNGALSSPAFVFWTPTSYSGGTARLAAICIGKLA